MTRQELVGEIAKLVGSSISVQAANDGWPALATVVTETGEHDLALFVGSAGLSGRGRDDVERRFQNPGQNRPIEIPPDRVPLLLGLWDADPLVAVPHPVLYAADATKRETNVTRFSVFAKIEELQIAADEGWSEAENATGETITYFHPSLLPTYVEALVNDVHLPAQDVELAVEAAGIPEIAALPEEERTPLEQAAAERVRRATSAVVRDARFSRWVLSAYEGKCALCGIGLGLVQGAAHLSGFSAWVSGRCPERHRALQQSPLGSGSAPDLD